MAVNLSQLSETERALLVLLAAGHTVKSAATLTGSTENAVNERLREARRKTGVGSSRELARLVVGPNHTQENRDDFSGLAMPTLSSHSSDAPAGRVAKRWLVMGIVGTGIALTALAVSGLGPSPTSNAAPSVVETTPADRAIISPGPITIRVTFDQPMRANSFSFVTTDRGRYPDCARRPQQSSDRRSFTLVCRAVAPGRYAISFNGGRFQNFVGLLSGISATPAVLSFVVR